MTDTHALPGSVDPEILVATRHRDGTLLFANEAWKQVLGSGDDIWERFSEEDRRTAEQNFKEACGGSLVTHALFLAVRPDRDLPAPVLLSFIPVPERDEDGAGSRSVVLTGEVLAEPESWTDNQTVKHRMETLGRMTMGITHDFNNLLGGILGHIALLEAENDPSEINDNVLAHISVIEKAARDGAELINKIQRYIRQEKKAAFERINLSTLIGDCVVLTKPYWYNEPRRRGIEISVSYEEPEEVPVDGSAAELRDVFVNLLLNAVQAMPEGGNIDITLERDDLLARVILKDSGTGMPEDVRSRIFEPLFTTKTGRGSGMGLAVTLGTIQEHEGRIAVSSEWGSGTEFTIELPVLGADERHALPEEAAPSGTDARILVVDDEEMVRKVVSRLLTLRGHDVTATGSAGEALELLQHHAFDIVLSDQGMPGMNGREFAAIVKQRHKRLPFVLLTGDTDITVDPDVIQRVLSKPFKVDELDSAIRELVH